jgi:hypothetical protein
MDYTVFSKKDTPIEECEMKATVASDGHCAPHINVHDESCHATSVA